MLVHAQLNAGARDSAIATLRRTLASAGMPRTWEARMLALLALLERASTGDLDAAGAAAREALAAAEKADDPLAAANALFVLWQIGSLRRDHPAALDHLDRALRVMGDDAGQADLRLLALDARIFTLQNLDQWPQAELALRQSRRLARRAGRPERATWANAAVLYYWLGQWDDALAELDSVPIDALGLFYTFLHQRWFALLTHGVAALIDGRRDQRTSAGEHLRQGLALPIETISDRENQDFLVAAHALALEQDGQVGQAMARLATLLPRRGSEMTLTHQWLPDLVRLALTVEDSQTAQAALRACQEEAAAETRPARAAAASLRCRGLLKSDPDPLRDAVAHYRAVGPAVDLPAALEDLAVVLAARGQDEEARAVLNEAVSLYDGLLARWDIRRAESRVRPYGIRRGPRGRRESRATVGWEALTATEVNIAALLARGDSTSDIAKGLFLSRWTVQTYISRILAKLGAKSRVDIVREALRHGVSP
jgi:DNA-binding CsgD family transcriptional regulator